MKKHIYEFNNPFDDPNVPIPVNIGNMRLADGQLLRLIFTPKGLEAIVPSRSKAVHLMDMPECGLGCMPNREESQFLAQEGMEKGKEYRVQVRGERTISNELKNNPHLDAIYYSPNARVRIYVEDQNGHHATVMVEVFKLKRLVEQLVMAYQKDLNFKGGILE